MKRNYRSITQRDYLKGGKADKQTPKTIADKHGVSIDQINRELIKGAKVELEHTDSKEMAREVALDHLTEFPDYYTRLDKMEKGAKKELKLEQITDIEYLKKNLLRALKIPKD